jgi:hypothetical protein
VPLPSQSTLRGRAAEYFGTGNTRKMRGINMGVGQYAFVDAKRLWIYRENRSANVRSGIVVRLTGPRRDALLEALGKS